VAVFNTLNRTAVFNNYVVNRRYLFAFVKR
jgi:hypothetical protein